MLDAAGRLWVTDFGLARLGADGGLTMTGDLLGTLRYMSPEQALAKHGLVDHRTDVYALGVTLYELLALRPAVDGKNRGEILQRIATEEPAPPRRLDRAIPAELETILLKAIEKNPSERYATAQEFADDLKRFLKDEPIHAKRPSLAQRARKWSRRHRALVWSVAVCLLAAALALTGSIGWTLHDRAAQRELAKDQVESPLRDAVGFLEEAKWAEAGTALDKAQALRARGGTDDQRQRIEALLNDWRTAKNLEAIRLRHALLRGDQFYQTDQSYARTFHDYGIDVDELQPEEAAEHIRSRTIRGALVAALDDWAATRWGLAEYGDRRWRDLRWRHLLAVARAADPDGERNRIRDALERKDARALKDLAAAYGAVAGARQAGGKVASLPVQTVVFFAEALQQVGALEASLTLLWQARALHPGDFWLNFTLAAYLHHNGELEAAIRFYTAALALRPDSAADYIGLGTALAHTGARDEGIAALRKAIELEPDFAIAHNNLGNILAEVGDPVGAVFHLRKAIELDPNFVGFYFNLGTVLHDYARLDAAVGALSPLPAQLSGVAFTRARHGAALAAFSKALAIRPGEPYAHFNRGLLLDELGKFDEAADDFRKTIEGDRGFALAYLHLGKTLEKQRKLAEAEKAFRQAVAAGPQPDRRDVTSPFVFVRGARVRPAEAPYSLGRCLWKQKRLPEAEEAFREAIAACLRAGDRQDVDVQHDLGRCWNALGRLLAEQGKNDKAEAAFRDALAAFTQAGRMRPTDFQAGILRHDLALTHDALGDVLVAQSKYAEAEAALRQALRGLPGAEAAGTYLRLGGVLALQGRPAEAERFFRRAVAAPTQVRDARHDLGTAHDRLGMVLAAQGKDAEAEVAYRRALEIWHELEKDAPQSPECSDGLGTTYHNLGLLLRHRGWRAEAEKALREAVRYRELAGDTSARRYGVALFQPGQVRYRELAGDTSATPERRTSLAVSYSDLGSLLRAEGRQAEAEKAYDQAARLLGPLASDHASAAVFQVGLAQHHLARGLLLEIARPADAEKELREAVKLFQELVDRHPDVPEYREGLGTSYNNLGRLLIRGGGRADAAEQALREARKHLESLADKFPGVADYSKSLAVNYSNLALLLGGDRRRADEAEQFKRKALELYRRLEHDYPTVPEYKSGLAAALHNAAFDSRKRNQLAEARQQMEQAVKLQRAALEAVGGRHSRYRENLRNHYWGLTEILLEAGDHAGAAEVVENLPRLFPDGWEEYVRAVRLLADCAMLAEGDARLSPEERKRRYSTYVGRIKELLGTAAQHVASADPKTAEARQQLAEGSVKIGTYYSDLREWARARQSYEKAIQLQPALVEAHEGLAVVLDAQGKTEDAVAAYRTAGKLCTDKAKAAQVQLHLGNCLARRGRFPEAEQEFRRAVELQPNLADAHYSLGRALGEHGKNPEAIRSFRAAIDIRPDYAAAYESLATALEAQNKTEDAVAAYRTAGKLYTDKADAARVQLNLGACLARRGRLPEAEKEFRRAVELQPKLADAHFNLGVALAQQDRNPEAIRSFRAAIDIKPDYAAAWGSLGLTLQREGEFADALKALQKSRDLLPPDDPNRRTMQQYVDRCNQLIDLDRKLAEILKGAAKPKSAAERVELAQVCVAKKLYGTAARFYQEAFAEEPRLAEELRAGRRYEAARAASRAGGGRGKDDPPLDDEARARWRKQALDWLKADLELWGRQVQDGPPAARAAAGQKLAQWQGDPALAGVRGGAIAELPEAEREAWRQLWADVETLLARVRPQPKEPQPDKP
jgi:tetratricopeptide (TPR) repeat protein